MITSAPPRCGRPGPASSSSLLVLLSLLLLCVVASSGAAPLYGPKRMMNGYSVDLTPLFHWWTNHQGERPLGAWVHVQGTITGTNAWGWVMSGQAERSTVQSAAAEGDPISRPAAAQFILKNPPTQAAAEFQRLHEELGQAKAQRQQVQNEAASAKSQEERLNQARRVRGRAVAMAQARQVEQADNKLVKSLDQRISDLQKKLAAFPNPDHYAIDAFALDTGTQYGRLPVFDHGLALK